MALKLLNSSSGPLISAPFDIVHDYGLTTPLLSISKSLSTSLLESTSSQSTPTKIVTSPDRHSKKNDNTSTPCLPWWSIKTLESTGFDVGDIAYGCQTHSHKQKTSVSLMTRVLKTCDLDTYAYAKGQREWE